MRTTKIISLPLASFILGVLIWSIIANGEDRDQPDPSFLSKDLYFRVNDLVISVPVVAVMAVTISPNNINPLPEFRTDGGRFGGKGRWFATREYKSALLKLASDRTAPAEVASIWLNFEPYNTYGEYGISTEICPRLSRDWSQKACVNQLRKELKKLPPVIYLSTDSGLNQFKGHFFSGVQNVTVFHLIEAMAPILPIAKMACADGQKFCYAAILVSGGLYAVWNPSCSNITDQDCKNDLEAQGSDIQSFVDNDLRVE